MIIGTRGSRLALAQTHEFMRRFSKAHPTIDLTMEVVRTTGDVVTDRPLATLGGYGAFVRELDARIREGVIDISVNSLKDVPVLPQPGLVLPAVLEREGVEDVMIPLPLDELPLGAVVGTSSVRRRAMLLHQRPDLVINDIRGNVPTRMAKVGNGYDAIILAGAGLRRLGLEVEHHPLDPAKFVPAPGQGAIGMVCRQGSDEERLLVEIDHRPTMWEVSMERAVMSHLGAGCSSPVGINADHASSRIIAVLLDVDGAAEARVDRQVDGPQDVAAVAAELKEAAEAWS